jgi:hypothetical protein
VFGLTSEVPEFNSRKRQGTIFKKFGKGKGKVRTGHEGPDGE